MQSSVQIVIYGYVVMYGMSKVANYVLGGMFALVLVGLAGYGVWQWGSGKNTIDFDPTFKTYTQGWGDSGTVQSAKPSDYDTALMIHDLVNKERAKAGVLPLDWSETNAAQATTWAQTMSMTGNFDHSQNFCNGENIYDSGSGSSNPQSVVQAWMNSEGHRANLLRATFHSEGIGVYGGYVSENFC